MKAADLSKVNMIFSWTPEKLIAKFQSNTNNVRSQNDYINTSNNFHISFVCITDFYDSINWLLLASIEGIILLVWKKAREEGPWTPPLDPRLLWSKFLVTCSPLSQFCHHWPWSLASCRWIPFFIILFIFQLNDL